MRKLINILEKRKIPYYLEGCFIIVDKLIISKKLYNKLQKIYYIEENELYYNIFISETKPQKQKWYAFILLYIFYFIIFVDSKLKK